MFSHFHAHHQPGRFSCGFKLAGLFCAFGLLALIALSVRLLVGTASAKSGQAPGQPAQARPEETLALRQPLERKLTGGEAHRFSLALKAGQFARVVVTQEGVDVVVRLLDASDRALAAVDSPNGDAGDETLCWVAQAGGTFRVEVRALDPKAAAGQYQIELVEARGATAADEKRIAAQRRMTAGNQLREQGKPETLRQAIAEFEAGLKLWLEVGEQQQAPHSMLMIGWTLADLGEKAEAQKRYEQARRRYEEVKDQAGLAMTQQSLGNLSKSSAETGEAEKTFAEAEALRQQGTAASSRQAVLRYEAAAQLYRAEGNKAQEALCFLAGGFLSSNLGEKQEALKYYNQALPLMRAVGDRRGEATTLHNIGLVYDALGEQQEALKFYNQALPLFRAVGDRRGEATTLNNIGLVYADLGEKQEALKFYNQALPLIRAVGDRSGEASTLTSIGLVYSDLGEQQEALKFYNQALPLMRAVGDRSGAATTLTNIGVVYSALGEKQEALKYYNQALPLMRAVGDRSGAAATLNNIGGVYNDLGEKQEALKFYNQALPLSRAVGDRSGEATTLNNLMFVWKAQQQMRVAVYYGKQSVNRYQELRAAISGLDKELQRSFLKSKEDAYRTLADLLISLGRLPEAQQVLGLLKEEEYFSYVRRDGIEADALKGRATLTPTEARLEKEYAEIADLVTTLGKELEGLNRLTQPLPAQLARRTEVDGKLRLATERFQAYLGRLEKELGNSKDAGERLTQIQTSEGFQDTLRELGAGTVALYTVVGEQKYSVILTPGSGPQVAAETNISREELNKKIFALKDALRNPKVDPRPLAAELYNLLIAPMEKNLEGAKAETLMFSLDGALRYLPMAALYDAKRGQYLIERYRVVIYTPAGATDLKNPARASWQGLGFGVSKAVKNDEVGSFSALSGVPLELRSVIRSGQNSGGVMEGAVYLDEQFTEQRFSDEVRRRQFPLIHIASHFSFKPGDSLKSFLLLGDGKPLTMEKLRSIPNLFSGVDLLALSACETGVGEKDGEGKEVEGFGVLAQRKGAKAVLATLWPVADESTAKLMQEFYRLRETQKGMNKAEALRQAQLSLLRGGLNAGKGEEKRAEMVGAAAQTQATFKADPNVPYAHPYYWAPFILIGNWR